MRDLIVLTLHLITTVFRLAGRGGLRAVVATTGSCRPWITEHLYTSWIEG